MILRCLLRQMFKKLRFQMIDDNQELEAMVKLANELNDSTIAWLHRFHQELLKPSAGG
jgi:hypothetical protein